jgi:tRNA nucleotidyltransferase/poly(A) polymerase
VRLAPDRVKKRLERLDVIRRIRHHAFAGPVFLVGGALRECALGHTPNDYDLALSRVEDLSRLEEIFGASSFLLGKKPIQTHRIVAADTVIDVTLLKGGIEEDLLRRDFTINAMAYSIEDGLIADPFGGFEDIEARLIRCPAEGSLRADPLRMVKAVRHLSALSGFTLDPALTRAMESERGLVHRTAVERIRYELDLIMVAKNPYKGIKAMEETGLLFEIVPELTALGEMDRERGLEPQALGHTIGGFRYMGRIKRFHPFTERETRHAGYALLLHDLGKAGTFSYDEEKGRVHFFYHERLSREMAALVMDRLRFSASDMKSILSLIENHMRIFLISNREATEKATRRIVYKMEHLTPALIFLTLLDLYGSSHGRDNESTALVLDRCRELLRAYDEWKSEPLARIVTGHDLLALGFGQGPALGQVLEEIREKQIAGEIMEKGEALHYAAGRLAAEETSSGG